MLTIIQYFVGSMIAVFNILKSHYRTVSSTNIIVSFLILIVYCMPIVLPYNTNTMNDLKNK